jgi:hypothetical protein
VSRIAKFGLNLKNHVLALSFSTFYLRAAQSTPGMSGPSQETCMQEVGDIILHFLVHTQAPSDTKLELNL